MVRKSLLLALSAAVLASTGVASPIPCCTLQELVRPAATEVRDCCDKAGCCSMEKRGPAQASLSIKAPDAAAPAVLPAFSPFWLVDDLAVSAAAFSRLAEFRIDHPPPGAGRDTHLKLSVLRI